MKLNDDSLTKEQEQILFLFINEFLPMRGNNLKHSGNEIQYITDTLSRVFKKYFGYPLCRDKVLNAFSKLGYDIFTKNASWDCEKKNCKPSVNGDIFRIGDVYSQYDCAYIYVDIDAVMVRYLRKSTMTLPPNTNADLREEVNALRERIERFVSTYKDNRES